MSVFDRKIVASTLFCVARRDLFGTWRIVCLRGTVPFGVGALGVFCGLRRLLSDVHRHLFAKGRQTAANGLAIRALFWRFVCRGRCDERHRVAALARGSADRHARGRAFIGAVFLARRAWRCADLLLGAPHAAAR